MDVGRRVGGRGDTRGIVRFDMRRCALSKLSRSLDENVPENFKGGGRGDQWGRALSANGSPDR